MQESIPEDHKQEHNYPKQISHLPLYLEINVVLIYFFPFFGGGLIFNIYF